MNGDNPMDDVRAREAAEDPSGKPAAEEIWSKCWAAFKSYYSSPSEKGIATAAAVAVIDTAIHAAVQADRQRAGMIAYRIGVDLDFEQAARLILSGEDADAAIPAEPGTG